MLCDTKRLVCCYILTFSLFHVTSTWRSDRRPHIFGDKVPRRALEPVHRRVQRNIVLYHNFFRTRVTPPAADMLSMSWNKDAARSAQRWAEQCMFLTHDNVTGRWVDNFGSCGQNIFVSTQQVPWYFAIKTWFLERHDFTYGSSHNNLYIVGHYTLGVWATTHKVGCGFQKCELGGLKGKPYYNYVCNYCPIGNFMDRLGQPYKKGVPCSHCSKHCRLKKLCMNSCPSADLWANCRELNSTWHDWLCHNHSHEGHKRRRHCSATCNCHDKII